MEGMGPDWKGLLKWSMANSDGTQPAREIRYASLLSLKDFLERFFFSFFLVFPWLKQFWIFVSCLKESFPRDCIAIHAQKIHIDKS